MKWKIVKSVVVCGQACRETRQGEEAGDRGSSKLCWRSAEQPPLRSHRSELGRSERGKPGHFERTMGEAGDEGAVDRIASGRPAGVSRMRPGPERGRQLGRGQRINRGKSGAVMKLLVCVWCPFGEMVTLKCRPMLIERAVILYAY